MRLCVECSAWDEDHTQMSYNWIMAMSSLKAWKRWPCQFFLSDLPPPQFFADLFFFFFLFSTDAFVRRECSRSREGGIIQLRYAPRSYLRLTYSWLFTPGFYPARSSCFDHSCSASVELCRYMQWHVPCKFRKVCLGHIGILAAQLYRIDLLGRCPCTSRLTDLFA